MQSKALVTAGYKRIWEACNQEEKQKTNSTLLRGGMGEQPKLHHWQQPSYDNTSAAAASNTFIQNSSFHA